MAPAPDPEPRESNRPRRDDDGGQVPASGAPEQALDEAPVPEPEPPAEAVADPPAAPVAAPAPDPDDTTGAGTRPDPSIRGDLTAALTAVAPPQRPPPEITAVVDAFGTDTRSRATDIGNLATAAGAGTSTVADPTLVAVTLTLSSAFGAATSRSLGALFTP